MKIILSIIAIIALFCYLYAHREKDTPSEYEGLKYRLKAPVNFHIGLPPTVNQSGIHEPNILIEPCFVLVFLFESRGYLVFKIKANTCAMEKNQAKNGTVVYYEKQFFDELGKYEIT